MDDLETYDEPLQKRVRELTVSRLKPMRVELTKFILRQSNRYKGITEIEFVRFHGRLNQNA